MDFLTIKDISRELEVPESNLRYYRDRFEDFLPCVGQGRKRRYKNEALEVFRFIVQGFKQDKTTEQIAEELPKHFPRKLDVTQEDPPPNLLLSETGEQPQISVYQLLQNQAKTLERFSRLLFSRSEPADIAGNIKSDQMKLKKGIVLLHRDVKHLKSSLPDQAPLAERCAALEKETAALKDGLDDTTDRLHALEERSQEQHRELRRALGECLRLMRCILELENS